MSDRLSHILEQPLHKPPVSPSGRVRSPANAHKRRHPSIKNGQIIRPLLRAARCVDFIGMLAVTLCCVSLGRLSFCVHGNTLTRTAKACQLEEVGRGGGSRLSSHLTLAACRLSPVPPCWVRRRRRRSMAHLIESER